MGSNEFVFMADIPADVQGPKGAGAVPSTRSVSHSSQHSCRSQLTEGTAQRVNSGRAGNDNNGHGNINNKCPSGTHHRTHGSAR